MSVENRWQLMQRASPIGSDLLLTSATNILIALIGLATGILAARLLGPAGRGELAAIQLWPSVIAIVAMLGLPEALLFFSAREPDRAGTYTGSVISLALLSAIPFMLAAYGLMSILLSSQSTEIIAAAKWYLLFVPISVLVGMPLHSLRGRNDLVVWNALRILPALGWLAVLVFARQIRVAQPSIVAGGYLAVLTLVFLPTAYVTIRRIPGPFLPNVGTWGKMLRFGLPSMLGTIPQTLNFRLDQMLIAVFLPARLLGLYVVAVAWSSAVSPLTRAVGAVLFPRVASQKTRAEENRVFAQGVRLGLLLSITIALILIVLTPLLVPVLFGAEFAESVPTALILVLAGAVAGWNLILEQGIRGLGHPKTIMWAEYVGLVVTALLLALLLGPLGIAGAALASLLGYFGITLMLVPSAVRITGYSPQKLLLPTAQELRLVLRRIQHLAADLLAR